MNNNRPINLNLLTIRFPLSAIISILHRISGIVLFLGIPAFLCALQTALASPASFRQLKACLAFATVKFGVWILISTLLYHMLSGIRHMAMDCCHCLETKHAGRMTAIYVLVLAGLLSALFGVWLL